MSSQAYDVAQGACAVAQQEYELALGRFLQAPTVEFFQPLVAAWRHRRDCWDVKVEVAYQVSRFPKQETKP